MGRLFNLARVQCPSNGTGSSLALGSAIPGYLTFAQAGVTDGTLVSYGIEDGTNSEVGEGVVSGGVSSLTRNVTISTAGNSRINLTGAAQVYITVRAEDLMNKTGDIMTGQLTIAMPTPVLTLKDTGTAGSYVAGQRGLMPVWNLAVGYGAGADFGLQRFNDQGTYVGDSIGVNRATGNVTLRGQLTVTDTSANVLGGFTAQGMQSSLGYNYSQGKLVFTTANGYNSYRDLQGHEDIIFGGAGDQTNYYCNTKHVFYNMDRTVLWGTWNATGLTINQNLTVNGSVTFGSGSFNITNLTVTTMQVTGNSTVAGAFSAASIYSSGTMTSNGAFTANGVASIGGNLNVGSTTNSCNLVMGTQGYRWSYDGSSTVNWNGNVSISASLTVNGSIATNAISCSTINTNGYGITAGGLQINGNGAVTGSFSFGTYNGTLNSNGSARFDGYVMAGTNNAVGNMRFHFGASGVRYLEWDNSNYNLVNGSLVVNQGSYYTTGNLNAANSMVFGNPSAVGVGGDNGHVYVRTYGGNSVYIQSQSGGTSYARFYNGATQFWGDILATGNMAISGAGSFSSLTISSTGPTITMADTDWGNMSIHHQQENMGFLNNGGGWIFYVNNSGSLWTAQTGWITDYIGSVVAGATGGKVLDMRLAWAGEVGVNDDGNFREPVTHAVITGFNSARGTIGSFGYRYVQFYRDGQWLTALYA
jgi:hypothetical protein